jgi:hypothetical protein
VLNNLPIGGWHAETNPERMKLEIVEGLQACIEGNAMQRYRDVTHKLANDSEEKLGKSLRGKKPRRADRAA